MGSFDDFIVYKDVWISQYWRSTGVFKVDRATSVIKSPYPEGCIQSANPNRITVVRSYSIGVIHYDKPHWHTSLEDALAQVDKELKADIGKCERKLTKLRNFKVKIHD